MKTVDQQRMLGNFGEAHVAALLTSGGCFVRGVASGTDVGIDLYCETTAPIADGTTSTPFLHFWVQVRTGSQCMVRKRGVCCAFELKDLDYWYRQPLPVFVALVPTEWPPSAPPTVHIVDAGSELVFGGPPTTGRTLYAGLELIPGDQRALRFLLDDHVPTATAIIDCKRGVVGNRPTLSPQYIGRTPLVPAGEYSPRIAYQLRVTAANSVICMWRSTNLLVPAMADNRRLFAEVSRTFARHGTTTHWENHFALGLSLHADGMFADAIEQYRLAIAVIAADRRIDQTSDPWARHLLEIHKCIAEAQASAAPAPPESPTSTVSG